MTKMKIARMTICDRFTVALRWVLFVARLADINHWRARSKFTTLPIPEPSTQFTTWQWHKSQVHNLAHTLESLDSEVGDSWRIAG